MPQDVWAESIVAKMMWRSPGIEPKSVQFLAARAIQLNDFAVTVETKDPRLAGERAKHDCDATVRGEMSSRFVAAAGEVEVAEGVFVEATECIDALGRQINPAFGRYRGRKEHLLLSNERLQFGRDFGVEFAHR
jgi:hypothetical protein